MSSMHAKIGDVARKLFVDEGVEGLTMRRVASQLGVTPTAIYRHFTNKEELVDFLVDDGFAILERKLDRVAKSDTGQNVMKKLLRCYLDFAIKYPRYFDLMFLTPRSDTRLFPADFRNRKSSAFNLLLDLVATMIEHRELKRDDALETSLTIWAQVHGLATLYRGGRFGNDPARIRAILGRSIKRLLEGLE